MINNIFSKKNAIITWLVLSFAIITSVLINDAFYRDSIMNQTKKMDSISVVVKDLNNKIKIDTINNATDQYLNLRKEILEHQTKLITLSEKVEKSHKSWIMELIRNWVFVIAALIGVITFFGVRTSINNLVAEQVAKLIGVDVSDVKNIIKSKINHIKLRKDKNVFILNQEGSEFTDEFKNVMQLFHVDTNNNKYLANINGLNAIDKNIIEQIRKHDYLVIENQAIKDEHIWDLNISMPLLNECNKYFKNDETEKTSEELLKENLNSEIETHNSAYQKLLIKIKKSEIIPKIKYEDYLFLGNKNQFRLEKEKCETKKYIRELEGFIHNLDSSSESEVKIKSLETEIEFLKDLIKTIESYMKVLKTSNIYNLVKLANSICDTTAIIYYGQSGKGQFPTQFVKPELQTRINFANAPAQLYGNLNNQMQFDNEMERQVEEAKKNKEKNK
ncbi:hypothetical protein [Lutibacter maritimus]|uniref:Uncharacterized protein n=1 Tax=Lutibacter maritimus TaxID=593133 RepID=A0A1I6SRG0_9FLAO|nr:hypothetical protein [Lutibacter maritimus]SFS79408.1 hypothetical protein SAMN04488006_0068 [Lutibacter maritimus]